MEATRTFLICQEQHQKEILSQSDLTTPREFSKLNQMRFYWRYLPRDVMAPAGKASRLHNEQEHRALGKAASDRRQISDYASKEKWQISSRIRTAAERWASDREWSWEPAQGTGSS
jgi:hypothetical protein